MPHPQSGMPTLEELRSVPEEELKRWIDQQLAYHNDVRSLLITLLYRDELVRREQDRATNVTLRLTRVIVVLTAVMLVGLGVQIYLASK